MIRVLIVDDSVLARKAIRRMLASDRGIEVCGEASNGAEALRLAAALEPDVVTLDLVMPGMDGLTTLARLREATRARVIVISATSKSGARAAMEALELGAADFVAKPAAEDGGGATVEAMLALRDLLIDRVRGAAEASRPSSQAGPPNDSAASSFEAARFVARPIDVVVIGASTGGPPAIARILSSLPPSLDAGVVVAQHLPQGFSTAMAERLARTTALAVRELRDGDRPGRRCVHLAPGGFDTWFEGVHRMRVGNAGESVAPCVDRFFTTAAAIFGRTAVAVLLTGMGEDGARGMLEVRGWRADDRARFGDVCHLRYAPASDGAPRRRPRPSDRGDRPRDRTGHPPADTRRSGAGAHMSGRVQIASHTPSEHGEAELEAIAHRVREETLLDFGGARLGQLARCVGDRMTALRIESLRAYLARIERTGGREELAALVELLANHETSFFRNQAQTAALEGLVLPELAEAAKARGRPLSILSAGCATGEEPYTVAMLCLDRFRLVRSPGVRILAIDLSRTALATAELGVYGGRALRDVPPDRRRRHFDRLPCGRHRVKAAVRALVSFRRLSLADEAVRRIPPMDLVLCRNVIIYFDEAGQRRCLALLRDLVRPGGYLLLGHTESIGAERGAFRPVHDPAAFAYRKVS